MIALVKYYSKKEEKLNICHYNTIIDVVLIANVLDNIKFGYPYEVESIVLSGNDLLILFDNEKINKIRQIYY